MKLAYTTTFDASDVSNWSGTPFHMSQAFEKKGINVNYMGSLSRRLPPGFKLKQFWKSIACDQRDSPRFNITAAKHYSQQISEKLQRVSVDAIVSPQLNPIVYLETKHPTVLWTDALYSSLVGFYPDYCRHSTSSIKQGNIIAAECLNRCTLAIFSSDWAARSALEIYGISKEKVKVVPFGANMQCQHTVEDIRAMLKTRSRETIKLLFLGKHWGRKGGDIVFKVAKALHAANHKVEVNFVGCHPPKDVFVPSYIKCHGFISKRTPEGVAKITQLLSESHFLFVPSRAEAFGIVFCEANAYGLPCLSSYVGGIATVVQDHVNGMTFGLDAAADVYCDYIVGLMQHYSRYEELALSSFNAFQTRLNWQVATGTVERLIQERL